jgi:hypothetical protein
MKLTDREKIMLGTMKLACCALNPECSGKKECEKLMEKLGCKDRGVIALSVNTFDRAKKKYLDNLYEMIENGKKRI